MIEPGKTIGIIGGGQLGRMFTLFARRMGYRVHVFDPTPDCPTAQVADVETNASYDDLEAARRFAASVDVVTFEFENVPAETLAVIGEIVPVYPSPFVLDTCRHRQREKDFLSGHGFPVADYRAVRNVAELTAAIEALGTPCILKTADYGYDGKGQVRIQSLDQASSAWAEMGRPLGVVEAFVPFVKELSVICARTSSGETMVFPPAENDHHHHILDVSLVPANVSADVIDKAVELAQAIAVALDVVGLITVELFLLPDNRLVVNELAPRPHNSGHYTYEACVTSQFEQQLRAVCGLPLGDTSLLKPVAMANLLGDVWETGEPNWAAALKSPAVKLHLYGKQSAKPGRKMGHLTAMADTPEAARQIVTAAREALQQVPAAVGSSSSEC